MYHHRRQQLVLSSNESCGSFNNDRDINCFFRLKEDNEHLLRQLNDRTQQYENEKSSLLLDHQRRLDDLQRDRTTELENLRSLQRFA